MGARLLNHAIAAIVLVMAVGCSELPIQTDWEGPDYDLGGIPNYENFYETFDKYPGYAIAEFKINETYDPKRDLEHLGQAVEGCRFTFGAAWRAGKLVRFPESSPPEFVAFSPRFVLIALKDVKGYSGASDFDASYRIAWLLPAADVFDSHKDAAALASIAIVDRKPFYFDPPPNMSAFEPAERYHWLIIEHHMKAAASHSANNSESAPN